MPLQFLSFATLTNSTTFKEHSLRVVTLLASSLLTAPQENIAVPHSEAEKLSTFTHRMPESRNRGTTRNLRAGCPRETGRGTHGSDNLASERSACLPCSALSGPHSICDPGSHIFRPLFPLRLYVSKVIPASFLTLLPTSSAPGEQACHWLSESQQNHTLFKKANRRVGRRDGTEVKRPQ